MITRKQFNTIFKLEKKMDKLSEKLDAAKETYAELRLAALQTVEMVRDKDGKVVALISGKRRLKVSYNTRYREYKVTENGKVLKDCYPFSIHEQIGRAHG